MASQPLADTAEAFAAEGAAMSESELASLLEQHAAQAVGTEWDEIAAEQEKAINYYYRRVPDLPAQEGCSSVVEGTVAVVIDNALAAVLKPFVSADDVVSFAPRGPEDVEQAEQATEYVNYVFNCDNNGFLILHNWFKDALLTKIGVIKAWWEDASHDRPVEQLADAMGVLEARQAEGYQGEQDNGDGTYTVTLLERVQDGRVKVAVVPPEEFKISPFARSIDEAPYVAHQPKDVTRSTLVEMGFDAAAVDALPTLTGNGANGSREDARYHDENGFGNRDLATAHKSQELIALNEEYIRVDYDGDGIAELRKVLRVGDVILLNEEVEEAPFALLCPVPMPHKVYGLSLADQVIDLQRISTVLWRQTLDNLYKSNNPRPIIPEGAERTDGSTLDSLADSAPGAAVYEGRTPIRYEGVPFTADKSFPMLEFAQQQQEERTGVSRAGQGLDTNALKKSGQMTATEMAIVSGGKNARVEMIARIFAETGVKRLFKLILKLVVRHQPRERIIRLRNTWVPIDPRGWDPEMDLEISVGLGVGDKNEQIAQAQTVLQSMAELGQTPYAALIDMEKVRNALKRLYHATGIKNVDDFLNDPEQMGEQPEKPDPEMEKVKGEQAIQQAKLQGEQEAAAVKLQIMQQEAAAKLELARQEAEFEAVLAQQKADAEFALAEKRLEQELLLAERRMQMDERMADHKASLAEKSEMSKNRAGGSLAE